MENVWGPAGESFKKMSWAYIELLGLYLLLPMVVAALVLKLLKISGPMFKFFVGIVGLAGLYFMVTNGIKALPDKIQ